MKKLKSIWLKLCLVCFLLGAVLTAAGFGMGAGKYMNSSDQKNGENEEVTFQESYVSVENLAVSLAYTELEIKEGEVISVSGIGIKKENVEIEYNEKTLKIHTKKHNFLDGFGVNWENGLNIGYSNQNSSKIVLTIPRGAKFDNVSLEVGAGTLGAEKIDCRNLTVSVGAGEGIMKNISAGNAEIEVGAGTLNLQNMSADTVELECGMGKLIMDGSVEERCSADCGMGDIDLKLAGDIEEYRYSVDCGMGTVKINEDDYSGIGTETKRGDGEKALELGCGMGNINVEIRQP